MKEKIKKNAKISFIVSVVLLFATEVPFPLSLSALPGFFQLWFMCFCAIYIFKIAFLCCPFLLRLFNLSVGPSRLHRFSNSIGNGVADWITGLCKPSDTNMDYIKEKAAANAAAYARYQDRQKAAFHDYQAKRYAGTRDGEWHKNQANRYRNS